MRGKGYGGDVHPSEVLMLMGDLRTEKEQWKTELETQAERLGIKYERFKPPRKPTGGMFTGLERRLAALDAHIMALCRRIRERLERERKGNESRIGNRTGMDEEQKGMD